MSRKATSHMIRKQKSCRVCGVNECKRIEAEYPGSIDMPIFCSHRCAAQYALLQAGLNGEQWCRKCGEWHLADALCGCHDLRAVI